MIVSSHASMPVAVVLSSLHDACCNAATDSPSQDRRRGVHCGGALPAWARRTLCTAPPARCRPTAFCTSRCWAGPASTRGALPRQVPAAAAKVDVRHHAHCCPRVRTMRHDTSCCMLRPSFAATSYYAASADAACHKAASFSGPSSSRGFMPKAPSDASALPLTVPAGDASSSGDGTGAAWLKAFAPCSTAIDATLAWSSFLTREAMQQLQVARHHRSAWHCVALLRMCASHGRFALAHPTQTARMSMQR